MICFRFGSSAALLSLPLLLVALSPSWSAPRQANTQAWHGTPFERNPWIFASWQQAGQALSDPDILLRRSGVEWLGQWTGTYVSYGVAQDKMNCDVLRGQRQLVPGLTRAVREMPYSDSQQAARLLTVIGPAAEPAIPTVCAALVMQGSQDNFKRYEVMSTLISLCGGPDVVAQKLVALLRDPGPETRCAAAGAAGLCDDLGFNHIGNAPNNAIVLSSSQSPVGNIKFRSLIIPALTSRVDDPVTAVRLAALNSLEALTYGPSDACLMSYQKAFDLSQQRDSLTSWHKTLPPLARAIASPDRAVRLAALRVLAYMPGDVSSVVLSLRSELNDGKEARSYALAALCHAAGTNRIQVSTVFLRDLSSHDLVKRRQAAAEVSMMVMPLWDGGFFPDQDPLRWWNDDRLFARYGDPTLTPKQKIEEIRQTQIAQEQTQQQLLGALVQACSDPDASVCSEAVASLELIGQWAQAASSHGFLFAPKTKSDLSVRQALTKAAVIFQPIDVVRAARLRDMSTSLWERTDMDFFKVKK